MGEDDDGDDGTMGEDDSADGAMTGAARACVIWGRRRLQRMASWAEPAGGVRSGRPAKHRISAV